MKNIHLRHINVLLANANLPLEPGAELCGPGAARIEVPLHQC